MNPRVVELADGTRTLRVPHGHEWPHSFLGSRCPQCGVRRGHLHDPGCPREQCPRCRGALADCGCLTQPTEHHEHPRSGKQAREHGHAGIGVVPVKDAVFFGHGNGFPVGRENGAPQGLRGAMRAARRYLGGARSWTVSFRYCSLCRWIFSVSVLGICGRNST